MFDCPSPTPGETPLHAAAFRGYSEVAALLLKAGADVRARDNTGEEFGSRDNYKRKKILIK